MSSWSGRGASTRLRVLALVALGTFVLSSYILFGSNGSATSPARIEIEEPAQPPTIHNPQKPPAQNEENNPEQLPPLYPELKIAELALPQHDEDLPFPDGKNARFVRFGNQMWGVGLNNQLFEMLLNTEIARRSGRAYVFAPFTWDPYVGESYVEVESTNHLAGSPKMRAAKVPLRAFFESPTSGAPWPEGDTTPRAVSDLWYDRICPQEKRVQIDASKVNKEIGVNFEKDEGIVIVDKWAMYLRNLDAQCANLQWETPRIIDFNLMGSARLLSIWPTYSISPVLTSFKWSPIVLTAVEKNLERLGLSSPSRIEGSNRLPSASVSSVTPELITLHVRRLDYKHHCRWMSGWADFEGWNMLDFLPDQFKAPGPKHMVYPNGTLSVDPDTDPRAQYMIPRCWLEIDTIVKRMTELKLEYADDLRLKQVYISTNGLPEWVDKLKEALLNSGWSSVMSTHDLKLTWEESGVDSAIDMELASRGQIFVGNGFSTFTSTVVSMRLARSIPAKYIRFW